ncbi:MAG: hypothetical protein E7311_05170 [Clostridiales bacterium]|nr:hypothetical protein [Clostridiales bacterium]
MLSDLTPAQVTMLAAVVSYYIFSTVNNEEVNAINNFLSLLVSNLSVQLAQQALLDEEGNNNNGNNMGTTEGDITPLVSG